MSDEERMGSLLYQACLRGGGLGYRSRFDGHASLLRRRRIVAGQRGYLAYSATVTFGSERVHFLAENTVVETLEAALVRELGRP
jgi:hypothetical protein